MFKHFKDSPFQTQLPEEIYFRVACLPAEATYAKHQHTWGEFVFSFTGIIEITMDNSHYLVPRPYGFWLPPNVEHTGFNHSEAIHCSLYVHQSICSQLPANPCALMVNPLIQALLEHLRSAVPALPYTAETHRLLQVLVDQLSHAPCATSYLPFSTDPTLLPILQLLQNDPANNQPIRELAKIAFSTERTLMRKSKKILGMSLTEWRQRSKIIKALPMLESNLTVEHIALELGYSSASAFIVMFKQLMKMTPAEFKRQQNLSMINH